LRGRGWTNKCYEAPAYAGTSVERRLPPGPPLIFFGASLRERFVDARLDAAEADVELFKHEYLVVDSSVRAIAYVGESAQGALHATLGASVPFWAAERW